MYQTPSQIWNPPKRRPRSNGHDVAPMITPAESNRDASHGRTTLRHGNTARTASTIPPPPVAVDVVATASVVMAWPIVGVPP